MITFIVHHMGTQGSFLNHLDLQQYLKDVEGHEIKFYCENVKRLFEVKILKNDIVTFDTVITDFKTLINLNKLKINIICDKLIIMDTIELTYHLKGMTNARFYYDVDLYTLLRGIYYNQILFLMPHNNVYLFNQKYGDLKGIPFYKHINIDILNTIQFKS